MAPLISCFACSLLLKEPFTTTQMIAAMVALLGVIFIAIPSDEGDNNTIARHSIAVAFGIVGVLGVSWAYTTIRWIGKRAHPLISVTYFSVWCTLISGAALLFVPSLNITMPSSAMQGSLLILIGFSGFAKQFLFTAGLAAEKGARPTNMVYVQLLITLALDKMVWNITPGWWPLFGSSLIMGSAVVSALARTEKAAGEKEEIGDLEEIRLLQLLGTDLTDDEDNVSL